MNNSGISRKQIILVVIIFLLSFLISRELFSNWDAVKNLFFGN